MRAGLIRRSKQCKPFLINCLHSTIDSGVNTYSWELELRSPHSLASNMAAPRPARPKPLDWSGPSHLAVFIRNLKLLHLDQREDWPGITIRALSPSSQNQRQRIRLIEWALYYLFTIWDPEAAQNVLHLILRHASIIEY